MIYTTHSHHLINVRWLDSAYVVKNAALGSLDFADYVTTRMGAHTSISATHYRKFVADHPDQTSYFQPVLDLLDYRPSFIEPVPDVVMLEGKSDFYLLRYATDILGMESDLRLVPGTGSGSLETVIRLHIAWGKSFVVLLDGDSEGKKQKVRYENLFGPILKARCLLLPDVCDDASAKEAENLLSAADRMALVDAVYAPGVARPSAKKAVSQAIMELYARRQTVKLEDATVKRIESLVSTLSSALAADSTT